VNFYTGLWILGDFLGILGCMAGDFGLWALLRGLDGGFG